MKVNIERLDDIWAKYLNDQLKHDAFMVEQNEKQRRALNMQIAMENQNLAQTQQERNKYLNSNVYRSTLTNDFYEQFNTTSR